jgi:hypothetical protein
MAETERLMGRDYDEEALLRYRADYQMFRRGGADLT